MICYCMVAMTQWGVLRLHSSAQDTVQVLMRTPDVLKSLQGILRRVKDVPRLLHRLQVIVSHASSCHGYVSQSAAQ